MTTNPEIAKRAYELWEQSGRPSGKHVEHWLQAETELAAPNPGPKPNRAQPLLKTAKPRRAVS